MKQFLLVSVASALMLGLASMARADSPWLTEAAAKSYARTNLGPSAQAYPVAIECRIENGKVVLRFKTKSGKKPFNKWQFAVSSDPLSELQRVSREYKIISSKTAGGQKCVIAYR